MARKAISQKELKLKDMGLLYALLVCLVTMVIMISACAMAISKEWIGAEYSGYCTAAILLISSMAGSKRAILHKTDNRIHSALAIGVIYTILLLSVTILFFDGRLYGVGVSIFVILAGCILPVVLGQGRGKRVKPHRSKKRTC